MVVTQREAATLLKQLGLGRRAAREVLDAGLAGEPGYAGAALLYDRARVNRLVDRPVLTAHDLAPTFPKGLLVLRCHGMHGWSADGVLREMAVGARGMGLWTRLMLCCFADLADGYPAVATVGGFVLRSAQVIAMRAEAGRPVLRLGPPGPWADVLEGARLPTGPGGRTWTLVEPWKNRSDDAA
jgi:hypothetical protein